MHPLVVEQGWDPYQLACYGYPKQPGPLVSIVCIGPLVKLIGSCSSLIVLMDFNLLIHLNWHYNPLTLMTPGPGCNAGWTPWRWY